MLKRSQCQCHRHARPQSIQSPIQPKRSAHTDRHGHSVVTKQLDPAADFLPPHTAQNPVTVGGQGIEQLERSREWEDLSDKLNHLGIAGEQTRDIFPKDGEQDGVEDAHDRGRDHRHHRARLGRPGQRGADQVRDARTGRNTDGEGDLEGQTRQRGQRGLSGQVAGAEVRGGEGEELKGQAFGFDHEQTGQGEADHGTPVVESSTGEAWPAGAAADETNVKREEDREEGVGYGDGDGSADESPLELLVLDVS